MLRSQLRELVCDIADHVCGWHALYNACCALEAAGAPAEGEGDEALGRLGDAACFWSFFWRGLRLLRAEARRRGSAHYPWRLRDVDSGCLERDYVDVVLKGMGLGEGGGLLWAPDVSEASMRNGLLEVEQIQALDGAIEGVRTHGGAVALVLGLLDHWVAVLVCRSAEASEVVLMDPRNKPVLGRTSADLLGELVPFFDDLQARGKLTPEEGDRAKQQDDYLRSLVECQKLTSWLSAALSGQLRFVSLCASMPMQDMLASFAGSVVDWKSAESSRNFGDEELVVLCAWLSDMWPPGIIGHSVVGKLKEVGSQGLPQSLVVDLRSWATFILAHVAMCDLQEITLGVSGAVFIAGHALALVVASAASSLSRTSALLHCSSAALFVLLREMDPGFLPKGDLESSAVPEPAPPPQGAAYCSLCRLRRPWRSKHCKACGRCVSRYDHHCGFVGKCVGQRNKLPFLLYLLCEFLCFSSLTIAVVDILEFDGSLWPFFALVASGVTSLLAFALLANQTYLAITNQTQYEAMGRHPHVPDVPDRVHMPFDAGCVENLRQFCVVTDINFVAQAQSSPSCFSLFLDNDYYSCC
eukprot:m51a1_g568 hypothetical protein (583) ;mRNA; f:511823-514847